MTASANRRGGALSPAYHFNMRPRSLKEGRVRAVRRLDLMPETSAAGAKYQRKAGQMHADVKALRAIVKTIPSAWVRRWRDGSIWVGGKYDIDLDAIEVALGVAGYRTIRDDKHLFVEVIKAGHGDGGTDMSTKSEMTRQQAIDAVGLAAVEAVEQINCEPTSRTQTDGDDRIEWAASINAVGPGGMPARLTAYYYTDPDELLDSDGEPLDDLSSVDWQIDGYAVW